MLRERVCGGTEGASREWRKLQEITKMLQKECEGQAIFETIRFDQKVSLSNNFLDARIGIWNLWNLESEAGLAFRANQWNGHGNDENRTIAILRRSGGGGGNQSRNSRYSYSSHNSHFLGHLYRRTRNRLSSPVRQRTTCERGQGLLFGRPEMCPCQLKLLPEYGIVGSRTENIPELLKNTICSSTIG
jgi:hypothetical protein